MKKRKITDFDYPKLAKERGVPDDILKRIEKDVEEDYSPETDRILYELHVLRAIKSGYWREWIKDKA